MVEILLVFLQFVSIFSKKIKVFLRTRNGILETVLQKIRVNDRVLWFHCASLGEFEQARPLIEGCKEKYPNHKIILTFFSPSGYDVQKNYPLADVITYLPFDRKRTLRKFIEILNPEVLFLIKYEFWPNLIQELYQKEIPIFSVVSIFRKEQVFFKPYGFYMKNLLKKVHCFFVQNVESQNLLRSINITNSKIIGDTRVDRVLSILKQNNTLSIIQKFKGNSPCFVVGSSWPEDIALISDTLEQEPEIKTIIAPHLVDEKSLKEFENSFEQPSIRLSNLNEMEQTNANILLIDCIGVLTKIYSYADLAYIGGGMGTNGLHNTLEPAVFGIPIIIGKNYKRYQEALDLVSLGGVVSVKSNLEFNKIFKNILFGTNLAKEMGKRNIKYINKYAGATDVFFEELNHLLNI
tara:strand:- start:31248 stop:32468 length:1221 start_codon:yes stop_codon:yes gene_type:complete